MTTINKTQLILAETGASINNNDTVITITGDIDCSSIKGGGVPVQLGNNMIVEAVSGTIPDVTGTSTITLRFPYPGSNFSGRLIAWNSYEGIVGAIQSAREIVDNISQIDNLNGLGFVKKTGINTYELSNDGITGGGGNVSGTVFTELGLSLTDQGRQPSYTSSGINMRKFDQKGVFNWIKRWSKNGLTYLYCGGKSGDTITGALARVQTDIIDQPVRPNIVNLWLGGNDINNVSSYATGATILATMKSELEQIITLLRSYGIRIILSTMPTNALWLLNNHKLDAQYKWENYLISLYRKEQISAFLNFGAMLVDPEAVTTHVGVSLTRTNNIVTLVFTDHGWQVGERIMTFKSTDPSLDTTGYTDRGATILTANANTVTFAQTGADTSGEFGTAVKINLIYDLVSDGATHFTGKGASKGALHIWPTIKNLFPPVDILSSSEMDYTNLVGTNKASTQFRNNLGMMYGTGGTKTGNTLPTGDVARGWIVNGGNSTGGSVVCSIINHPKVEFSNFLMQRLVIDGGSTGIEVSFLSNFSRPGVWSANDASLSGSNYRSPTIPNGYFYVIDSESAVTGGGTEPIWPTNPGETVLDSSGNFSWICKEGFIAGTTKLYSCAEYMISQVDDDAIRSFAWGMWDNTTGGDSILDFNNDGNPDNAANYYLQGEEGHFCTPVAALGTDGNSFSVGYKINVLAGKTCTIDVARATIRKSE